MMRDEPAGISPHGRAAARRPRRGLGREGLSYVRELLGGPAAGWELETASLGDLALDAAVVKDARRLELRLSRDGADGVRLSTRGPVEDLSEEEREFLAAARAGTGAASFTGLLTRLGRDSLLYTDPRGGSVPSRFERYYRVVDHSPDYWKFVYPQARFLEQEIGFGVRYAKISHATLECRLNNPLLTVGPLRFFADDPKPRAETGDSTYTDTDIGEADVVAGRTQEILDGALERVAREQTPAFIHLKTTCLPELVGDNPSSAIARLERDLGVPVLWTSKTRDPGPVYETMLERLLDAAPAAARDPRAVLLAGVPSPEAEREAAELLGALGLRVAGAVFPDLDARRAAGLGTAGAVVWLNPVGWEKIEDRAFLARGLAVVRHHPPFGLAGTKRWLERTASVLGLDGAEAAWTRVEGARAAELDALRAQCRERTIVLAGDRDDVELLTSSGRAFGFSVAGLLAELGFNVRCLVHGAGSGARRPKTNSGAGTVEFVPFSTRAQLDKELGRGIDLAFTHFNHDPRLEAHGLPGFTEAAFEPGLEGLLRAGRTLLRRCAARPFPRHRAFLTPWTS